MEARSDGGPGLANATAEARRPAGRGLLLAAGAALLATLSAQATAAAVMAPRATGPATPAPAALPARAVDLDAAQAQLLEEAKAHLKQVRTNLKLAQDGAGPGTAALTGSKARLAATRLAGAKPSVPEVEARLAKLPAGDAAVAAVRKDFDAAKAEIAALETRISGGTAPAQPATQGVRLDYRQEQALKDALFFQRDVEGKAAAVADIVTQVRAAADPIALDHRLVQQAMNTIVDARAKLGNANDRMATLPADGTGVPEAARALAALAASLDASEAALRPVHERLSKLIDSASYPELAADLARLSELTQMLGNPDILQYDRDRALEVIGQLDAARQEAARVASTYAALIAQGTDIGERIGSAGAYFLERADAFAAAVERQRQGLPAEMDASLARVATLVRQAVEESKPAFFTGGVVQQMDAFLEQLALYRVIAPQQAADYEAKLEQTRESVAKAEATLVEGIIASNELPPDRYQGADRASLIELARAALAEQLPEADVLAARIPSQDWERETLLRNQTGDWYKVDHSSLQVQLIVRRDAALAEVRPVNVWKDHLKGNTLSASPLYGKDEEVGPRGLLRMETLNER